MSSSDEAEEATIEAEDADADVICQDRERPLPVLAFTADSVPVRHSKLDLRPLWVKMN